MNPPRIGVWLLLAAHLLLFEMVLVQAGFFDGIMMKHKQKKSDKERAGLIAELSKLDKWLATGRRKYIPFSSMMSEAMGLDKSEKLSQKTINPAKITTSRKFAFFGFTGKKRKNEKKLDVVEKVAAEDTPTSPEPSNKVPELERGIPNLNIRPKVGPSSSLSQQIKEGYHKTWNTINAAGDSILDAGDKISALLKLDNRGRLLGLLEDVDEDMNFVRKEFASFSQQCAPIMESALSYIGRQNLEKMDKLDQDQFDFRSDALNVAAFGYEFMKLMMSWRENLLVGHQAYKLYLTGLQSSEKQKIGHEFIYQLAVIHNYILLNSWLQLDNLAIESKMKLDHLMFEIDMKPKNYESKQFRNTVVLQELYDSISEEIRHERKQVINALSEATSLSDEEFRDIDTYLSELRIDLFQHPENYRQVELQTPKDLDEFMLDMETELRYNKLVYSNDFLSDLKKSREKAISKMYENLKMNKA